MSTRNARYGVGLLFGLVALGPAPGCEEVQTVYHEGERIRLTVVERVNTWRSECVPLAAGDVIDLAVGNFDRRYACDYADADGCTQAPLERTPPAFASDQVSRCQTGTVAQPLQLRCTGHREAGCRRSMELRLSPIVERGQKVAEKGYLIVRWNLLDGNSNDAGVFQTCLDGCEEGFRVRIEMLDR
jgi:hypothetical protein